MYRVSWRHASWFLMSRHETYDVTPLVVTSRHETYDVTLPKFSEIDEGSRNRALLELCHKLPRVNFLVFERLIYHLAQVANEVLLIN
jgi:hypothetical protein